MSIQEDEHLTLRGPTKRKEGSFVKSSRKNSKGVRAGQGWDVPSDAQPWFISEKRKQSLRRKDI